MASIPELLEQARQQQQAGRLQEAEALYLQAAEAAPSRDDIPAMLSVFAYQTGRPTEALRWAEQAVRLNPKSLDSGILLGSLLYELKRLPEAETALQTVIQHHPSSAEAYNNLGLVLRDRGRPDEAYQAFQQACQFDTNFAEPYFNLGQLLHQNKRTAEAIELYQRGLALCPQDADARFDLGSFYQALNRFSESEACYREALQLQPNSLSGYTNLGYSLRMQGRLDEALDCYQKAYPLFNIDIPERFSTPFFKQYPDIAQLKFNEAVIHLLKGEYRQGWELFEWRFDDSSPMRDFEKPMWDGSPQLDKTLLIWGEQGLGDSIQFLRFLPQARSLVGQLIVELQPPLVPLLQGKDYIDRLFGKGSQDLSQDQFDLHLPLQSLPRLLNVELSDLPAAANYLQADPIKAEHWRNRLATSAGLKVGFVWSSNPLCKDMQRRRCPFELLYPLFEVPGVAWFSLQKGSDPTASELDAIADKPVTFLGTELHNFGDTAAVMANLDLVISVDTSVPHLAGAMGRPVWTLIAYAADWRWLQHREDTPWYPSMRLFRQPALGDWKSLIQTVKHALMEYTRSQRHDNGPAAV